MDKIVALCKRRGFIFPVVGDLRRHRLDVRLRPLRRAAEDERQERVVAGDARRARRHRRARLGDPPAPARLGGSGPRRRLHRPDGRLPHVRPALPRRPPRQSCRARRSRRKHPGEAPDCDLTEARDFNLMFETTVGPGEGVRLDRLPAPGDRAGHLHQLQERPAVRAQEAAVRHRPGRQVVPQRDHARQLHLPHARVRADGDGVLRPARRGAATGTRTGSRRASDWYEELGIRADHLRLRAHEADELSHYSSGTSDVEYLFPIGWSELEGIANRGDFDLSQHAEYSRREARVLRPGRRRALRPARHRAGGRRRPRDARVPRRRLRRGGGRGRDAHRAQAPPAPGAREGRGAAARPQGRPARARARGLRRAARRRCRPSTTRAARSASATAARTRSARRSA